MKKEKNKKEKMEKIHMKKALNYFKEAHRIIVLLFYIYGAYGTYCIIKENCLPLLDRIISGIIFGVLVILSITFIVIYLLKWRKSGIKETISPLPVKEPEKEITAPTPVAETAPVDDDRDIIIARDYKVFQEQLAIETTKIRIIVYHGNRMLSALKEDIINAITDTNVEVQLLIVKKDSVLIKEVWDLEKNPEPKKLNKVRELIEEIWCEVGNKSYQLKYKEYNTQSRYALVAFDSRWAWWTPYQLGRRVEHTTSFILTNEGQKSVIHECIGHFEILWNELPWPTQPQNPTPPAPNSPTQGATP